MVAIQDGFDGSPSGTLLVNHDQTIGEGWSVESGADPNMQDIQSAYSNGGNALRLFRPASSGTSHAVRASGHLYDASVAELTRVTMKADWLRRDGDESALMTLDLGGAQSIDPTIFANSDGKYWVNSASGWVNTNVMVGQDGWESIELVLSWGIAANDAVQGTFDVFLTRDAQNLLGALSRTLIADNIAVSSTGLASAMDIMISNQPGGVGDVVTYWDNVSLRVDPILDGDFDADGDIDGNDFLLWQRGESPNPSSSADLAKWRNAFGAGTSVPAQVAGQAVIPEPSSLILAAGCSVGALKWKFRRRR